MSKLHGPIELSLLGCHADIPYTQSHGELRWAHLLVAAMESEVWSLSLTLLYARVLSGIPCVYKRIGGEADSRREVLFVRKGGGGTTGRC